MRKIRLRAFITMVVLLFLAPYLCLAQDKGHIIIRGEIKNIDEAKERGIICEDSYLQLLNITNSSISFEITKQGYFRLKSDLPTHILPDGSKFAFNIPDLEPGKYVVVMQLLKGRYGSPGVPPPVLCYLVSGNSKSGQATYKIFTIKENMSNPANINLGEVMLPLAGKD